MPYWPTQYFVLKLYDIILGYSFPVILTNVPSYFSAPSAIRNLTGLTINSTAARISWTRPEFPNGQIEYIVMMRASGGEESILPVQIYQGPETQYVATGLKPVTRYIYSVYSRNVRYRWQSTVVEVEVVTSASGKIFAWVAWMLSVVYILLVCFVSLLLSFPFLPFPFFSFLFFSFLFVSSCLSFFILLSLPWSSFQAFSITSDTFMYRMVHYDPTYCLLTQSLLARRWIFKPQ